MYKSNHQKNFNIISKPDEDIHQDHRADACVERYHTEGLIAEEQAVLFHSDILFQSNLPPFRMHLHKNLVLDDWWLWKTVQSGVQLSLCKCDLRSK